jgi:hypothetical protein
LGPSPAGRAQEEQAQTRPAGQSGDEDEGGGEDDPALAVGVWEAEDAFFMFLFL